MKRIALLFLGFLLLLPSFAQSQPDKILEHLFERMGPRIRANDLKVLQLEISPDPVRERQWISFQATVSNLAHHSGRVDLFVKDRNTVIVGVYDVLLQPGYNHVVFPQTDYRFSRHEHCFSIEVDIGRTRRPVDIVKEFCARRTFHGWTLREIRVGPLLAEDLEMFPDPATPDQEVRFRLKLRNDGNPLQGNIRIQDRDQTVARLMDVFLPSGYSEYQFPYFRYSFERFDHCFTVVVEVDRTPYRADAVRQFCAKPLWWTLKP